MRRLLQLHQSVAGAVLDNHLKTEGGAKARNRRRGHHVERSGSNRCDFFLDVLDYPGLSEASGTLVPVVIDTEYGDVVGNVGGIQRRESTHRNPAFDAGAVLKYGVDAIGDLAHA